MCRTTIRNTRNILSTLLLSLTLLATPAFADGRADGASQDLTQAMRRGDWEMAERLANSHDDPPSLLVRAQLSHMRGDLEAAARFGQAAAERATSPAHKHEGTLWRARALRAQGKWTEADDLLREQLKAAPRHAATRYELGSLLHEQGKKGEAKIILNTFANQFNDGAFKTADELAYVARGMALLRYWDDANYALKRAAQLDAKNADVHVAWGELLLEKYNIADARASFEDALKHNPNHPDALIGMAQVELMTSNQTTNARELLDRAEQLAPREPKLFLTRAHLAIMADLDCDTGLKLAARALDARPRSLDAMTIQAICAYINDDLTTFNKLKADALAIHPTYSDLLSFTGEYAVRVFRYEASLDLYKEAIKLNPQDGRALLGMATSLSRVGREDEAREYLQRAFDADSYNVRAYNMLELYERVMPSYSFREYERFRLRTHNNQRDLLELLLPPLINQALQAFTKKYKFEIHPELSIEVYPDPTTFAVRTTGLPSISPHGVCFGRVVLSRSPSDGNFNWAQVMWHELAHVYHIQLSNSRVPRWFTEGLAEYETNVFDPSWSRHYDRELASQIFTDAVPSVTQFDHGFTQSSSMLGVVRAYHLASLSLHFIAETWGFDKIVEMLRAWGAGKKQEEVFRDVLNISYAQFDQRFLTWLKRRYLNFTHQLMVDVDDLPPLATLERELLRSSNNPRTWAKIALIQQRSGQREAAEAALKRALELAPTDATVLSYALVHTMRANKMREALELGAKILATNQDGYDLRLQLGQAALATEQIELARVHFEAATSLYEDGTAAWVRLATIAKNNRDDTLWQLAVERLHELDQNDPLIPKLRAELAIKHNRWERARDSAERWVHINPFDPASHRLVIQVAQHLKDPARAELAWRALIALQPDEADQLRTQAHTFFTSLKDPTRAARFKPKSP